MNNVTAERVDEGRVPAEGQRARICELSLHSDSIRFYFESICVRFDDDEIPTLIPIRREHEFERKEPLFLMKRAEREKRACSVLMAEIGTALNVKSEMRIYER